MFFSGEWNVDHNLGHLPSVLSTEIIGFSDRDFSIACNIWFAEHGRIPSPFFYERRYEVILRNRQNVIFPEALYFFSDGSRLVVQALLHPEC